MAKHGLHITEQPAYKNSFIVNDSLLAYDSRSATVLKMLELSTAFVTVSHLLKLIRR